ncbi:MAG: 3D domain-containing protein [Eubacterium sp.]
MKVRSKHAATAAMISIAILAGAVLSGYVIQELAVKVVKVVTNDSIETSEKSYETRTATVEEFLQEQNISFDASYDSMNVELDDDVTEGMTIRIDKAFIVPVEIDGETRYVKTVSDTVRKILRRAEVYPDSDDLVYGGEMEDVLVKGDSLKIIRVEHKTVTETITTPYETYYNADSSVQIGQVVHQQTGVEGITENTYDVAYHDGVEVQRKLVSSEVIQEKKDDITVYGTTSFSGVPSGLSYTKVLTCKATAYSASEGACGAYGGLCTYGTCAVDPSVIPLGTLLYIEGYGYAVANDVGSAVIGNFVDLFMEENTQCYIWGARTVNVYVLG